MKIEFFKGNFRGWGLSKGGGGLTMEVFFVGVFFMEEGGISRHYLKNYLKSNKKFFQLVVKSKIKA